jgi:SpoVK/Ycf46/Vps4 family AAA+-type ATPase
MAQHITSATGWGDLDLPQDLVAKLQALCRQAQQWHETLKSAQGLCAPFTGPRGAGKSLAATAIANALHTNLYRVDLAAVVGKHIVETEKNLSQLFAAAASAGAICTPSVPNVTRTKKARSK